MKKIFYHKDTAYVIVREIPLSAVDPLTYGITQSKYGLSAEQVAMQILKMWKNDNHCDHVLRKNGKYLLCRTIEEAQIIE
jgi:hypothetical protein